MRALQSTWAILLAAALFAAGCDKGTEEAPTDAGRRDTGTDTASGDGSLTDAGQDVVAVDTPVVDVPVTDVTDAATPDVTATDVVDAGAPDVPATDVPAGDASCVGDGGCYACPPSTTVQFQNRCTTGTCFPFDNRARVPGLLADGGVPPLP